MKKLNFTLALLVTIFLASCATTRIAYEEHQTRQSEPALLTPYVIPTVADLEVSETKELVTSTFDNSLSEASFKGSDVEEWKNVTLAKMIKEYNSDVIVAPMFDITTSKDLKTVTVELRGYPAKYTNFRNMQTSDSAAMRVHNIEIARPTVTNYSNTRRIETKTSKQKTAYREQFVRGGETYFMPEFGLNLGALGGDDAIIDFQATYGYEVNNYVSVGGGIGFTTYADDNYEKERAISVPVLVNFNGFFFESRVTPYYSVDLGFMMPLKKAKDVVTDNTNYTVYNRSYTKGLTFSPEIGVTFGDFRIGAEWKMMKKYYDRDIDYKTEIAEEMMQSFENEYNVNSVRKDKMSAFYLKVGFRF